MIKKFALPILLSVTVLSLSACVTTGIPSAETSVPTNIPPTETVVPSATVVLPTETPTEVPPTVTATVSPENVIQHYPNGQAFTVTDIHMIDETTGWAIGSLGYPIGDHVLKTTDGGSAWKDFTPPEAKAADGNKAAYGFFQDATTAWVTYAIGGGNPVPTQPVVWHTTDGGATWAASQPLDMTGLSEIFVPSVIQFIGQSGWILAHVGAGMNHDYVVIYHTSEGGSTWRRILDPFNDGGIQGCTKNDMLFTDATHGWLTGDCNGVKAGVLLYKTTDAGSTWQEVTLPEPASYPGIFSNQTMIACGSYDPFFFNNNLGYLSVNCQDYQGTQISHFYYVYSTQDGGTTWTSKTYTGEAIYFFSKDIGWALSKKIQRTTDGGATWTPISDVTWTAQFDFVNENIGWSIARSDNETALVKTVNGGARWSILTPTVVP